MNPRRHVDETWLRFVLKLHYPKFPCVFIPEPPRSSGIRVRSAHEARAALKSFKAALLHVHVPVAAEPLHST